MGLRSDLPLIIQGLQSGALDFDTGYGLFGQLQEQRQANQAAKRERRQEKKGLLAELITQGAAWEEAGLENVPGLLEQYGKALGVKQGMGGVLNAFGAGEEQSWWDDEDTMNLINERVPDAATMLEAGHDPASMASLMRNQVQRALISEGMPEEAWATVAPQVNQAIGEAMRVAMVPGAAGWSKRRAAAQPQIGGTPGTQPAVSDPLNDKVLGAATVAGASAARPAMPRTATKLWNKSYVPNPVARQVGKGGMLNRLIRGPQASFVGGQTADTLTAASRVGKLGSLASRVAPVAGYAGLAFEAGKLGYDMVTGGPEKAMPYLAEGSKGFFDDLYQALPWVD